MSTFDALFPMPTGGRNADDMGMPPTHCQRKKCGEYNMLKCVLPVLHAGECCFVVDHENDYEQHNKPSEKKKDLTNS